MENKIKTIYQKINLSNGISIQVFFNIVEKSKINLIIIPDICESIIIYEKFIKKLTDNSISTFIFDLPGQGKSDGKRGSIFNQKIYLEIFKKIFNYIDLNNGIHFYLSGLSAGYFIKLIYELKNPIWIRSIFLSGFNFSVNNKFFYPIFFKSIFKFSNKLDFNNYLKDKVNSNTDFLNLLANPEINRFLYFNSFLQFLFSIKSAFNIYINDSLPLLIASGKNQNAFYNYDLNKNINEKLTRIKKLPIKNLIFDGGHSFHLLSNSNLENYIKSYFDFLLIC